MKERLKLIRKHFKKTQEQFANLCGKSRTAYNKYEAGAVVPDDSFVKLICIKFNVNEQWLLTGEGEMFTETKVSLLDKLAEKYNLDKYDMSIIRHYMELDPEDRKKFVSLMKVIFASSPVESTKNKETIITQHINNEYEFVHRPLEYIKPNRFSKGFKIFPNPNKKPDNKLTPDEKRAIVNGEIVQEEKETIL
jgi:transcriptional regulator with XRE-family HTH domain